VPISRECLILSDLETPTDSEIALAQLADSDLLLVRGWVEEKKKPTADEIAKYSPQLKELALCFDQFIYRRMYWYSLQKMSISESSYRFRWWNR
jgi:hypothetical protein